MKPRIIGICLTLALLCAMGVMGYAQILGTVPPSVNNGGGASVSSVTVTVTVTFTPTAIPTITVPTAVATTGNVITMANFGSPSFATHDMIACVLQNSTSASLLDAQQGWSTVNANQSWGSAAHEFIVTHCIMATEGASYTFASLPNDASVTWGCVLMRNTSCGIDVIGTTSNNSGSTSTTVPFAAITTVTNNDLILYGGDWYLTGQSGAMTSPPAGFTVDVNVAAVNGTRAGTFLGHMTQSSAGTIASANGTINGTGSQCGTVAAAVAPIH